MVDILVIGAGRYASPLCITMLPFDKIFYSRYSGRLVARYLPSTRNAQPFLSYAGRSRAKLDALGLGPSVSVFDVTS